MNYKKPIAILGIFALLSFLVLFSLAAEEAGKLPSKKEKGILFPKTYSHGVKTTYMEDNTQEIIEKSEVKQGKIYFYNKKGQLVRTGDIKGDNVLYDKGDVKREKIRGNRIYQYDKDGKLVGKIEVRPYEIKKILPDGKIEKFKIKIKR